MNQPIIESILISKPRITASINHEFRMIHMRSPVILPFLFLAAVQAADPVIPAWTGFRGAEGSGVWATAKPPTTWDGATDKNIRWKAPLANWGLGQPRQERKNHKP